MWKVPDMIQGFGKINYPFVCRLTPVRGKAFCPAHVEIAEKQKIQTDIRACLKFCGLSDEENRETRGELPSVI